MSDDFKRRFTARWVTFVVSLLGATIARIVGDGAALGMAIAGLAMAAILVPPMVAVARNARAMGGVALSYLLGTILAWAFSIPPTVGWAAFASASAVLVGFVLAVAAVTQLLCALRIHAALAGAIVTTTGLAWLSWPVWLSHHLGPGEQRALSALVGTHPIFAINGISPAMGVWTQQRWMYRLTALGQDIPFSLPTNVWACIAIHLATAVLCFSACWLSGRRANQPAGDAPSGQ